LIREKNRCQKISCYSPFNLLTAVRMELGQEGWLKQLVAMVRRPIMAGDQGSHRGHQCSETSLPGEPVSIVSVGTSPGHEPLPPPPRQEANDRPNGPV
jgi:hypothetical protein